jgi:hypothetical protein
MNRDSKPRHVKGIPGKDESAIKGNNSAPLAQNRDIRIVAYLDPQS